MYNELVTDDASLSKVLLPEYMTYYSVSANWMRMVTLKEKNAQPLTVLEQDLPTLIQSTVFNIPEPLLLQLRVEGNIVTATKQHLYPAFPPMPAEVIAQRGGYYGALAAPAANVDDLRHTLYEEIPCLGVAAFGVRQAISNAQPGTYNSTVTLKGQQPTQNLLGFRPLGHRRPEAKNLALELGITDANFPSYPTNLAFNLELLIAISSVLADTITFKMTPVIFSTLTEIGAPRSSLSDHS